MEGRANSERDTEALVRLEQGGVVHAEAVVALLSDVTERASCYYCELIRAHALFLSPWPIESMAHGTAVFQSL